MLGLIKQEDRNAVTYGIESAATCALERFLVGSQRQFLAAVRGGADENIQQLLQHHPFNFKHRLHRNPRYWAESWQRACPAENVYL